MSNSGKRGSGNCSNCGNLYYNKYKPSNCGKCNFFIGGSYVAKSKKQKVDIPEAVQISENIFSIRTTYRNDRCFVSRNDEGHWICLYHTCKEKRAMFCNSGIVNSFRCEHTDKASDHLKQAEDYLEISEICIENYACTYEVREEISLTVEEVKNYASAPVVKISGKCYAVYARTTASNPLGFCHIKDTDGHYVCSGKDCRGMMAKARGSKVKAICIHKHILRCALQCSSGNEETGEGNVAEALSTSEAESNRQGMSISRKSSIQLAFSRKLPYEIDREILLNISKMDAKCVSDIKDEGWPEQFSPHYDVCQLCNGVLSPPMSHPGQKGKSYLLTELNPFKSIDVKVRMCQNGECKAMHQSLPYSIGLFNVSDKLMVSFDILLEIREFLKTGHPLSNVISAKLNILKMKTVKSNEPTDEEMKYIEDLLYNGFLGFEAMVDRNPESAICGICGVCPEVCLGDGNEKNCCSNAQILYTQKDQRKNEMLSQEKLMDKIKIRAMEKIVYTRNQDPFVISLEELPPLIPKACRAETVENTEAHKNSAFLKSSKIDGDPAILHQLVMKGAIDIENLRLLSLEQLKEFCTKCDVTTQRKSKETLIGNLYSLYSTIMHGLSPCHNFSNIPGKTGGFYHFVCRHGCTVASKFLALTESVRDAADIYMSLKYPPIVLINDTPCGLVRHMEIRSPEFSKHMWGDRCGCFETPRLDFEPNEDHDIQSIVPPEYKAASSSYSASVTGYEHPTSGRVDRYILGDRFHSSTNPHKSPLCRFHDINLCNQANALSTSIQESQNQRKNVRRLRSTCHQNFETHILFNFLMDYYQNEETVKRQKKCIEKSLNNNQMVVRDKMLRFVISDKDTPA